MQRKKTDIHFIAYTAFLIKRLVVRHNIATGVTISTGRFMKNKLNMIIRSNIKKIQHIRTENPELRKPILGLCLDFETNRHFKKSLKRLTSI